MELLALVAMELCLQFLVLPLLMPVAEAVAHHPELLHLVVMEVGVPEVLAREELLELPILVAAVVGLVQIAPVLDLMVVQVVQVS